MLGDVACVGALEAGELRIQVGGGALGIMYDQDLRKTGESPHSRRNEKVGVGDGQALDREDTEPDLHVLPHRCCVGWRPRQFRSLA